MTLDQAISLYRKGFKITHGKFRKGAYIEVVNDKPLSDTVLSMPYVENYLRLVRYFPNNEKSMIKMSRVPDDNNFGVVLIMRGFVSNYHEIASLIK